MKQKENRYYIQKWKYAYCCVQSRFAKPNHCLRLDSTKGFLSADQRSSSDINPLWSECILVDHIQNQQPSKIIPKVTLIIPSSAEFGDFHRASQSIQNYLQ